MCYKQKCKVVSLNLAHPVYCVGRDVKHYLTNPCFSACLSDYMHACVSVRMCLSVCLSMWLIDVLVVHAKGIGDALVCRHVLSSS